jgi:hypothetical protein
MKNLLLPLIFALAAKTSSAIGYSGLNDDLLYLYAGFIGICAFCYGLIWVFKKLKERFGVVKQITNEINALKIKH